MKRKPTKSNALTLLIEAGIDVKSVIDVGVQVDTPELREAFPNVPHILFEPVVEYNENIRENYKNVEYRLENIAISDREGVLWLKDCKSTETGVVTHVTPALHFEEGLRHIRARTLDNYLSEAYQTNQNLAPYLIKIDVDGHETEILRGAKNVLPWTSCLIVETTLPHLRERCDFAERCGLRLWDIVDINYYHNNLYQIDLIFVADRFFKSASKLDPNKMMMGESVDIDAWFEPKEYL
ncbi:FkbM family methyltransferase [Methylobacterium sp. E-066]|uniref:FkbM family methyltransferase n=1 Tax=Methylobacterium sp. E-066 TaxID=2836584 RepID=UPI001FBA9960|nr:FkbM family methyltransferase [Methylobacterium sp. E-066]MCJ2144267.1 FkbM family methyltransferase [Methylobacterium sp. E-066]